MPAELKTFAVLSAAATVGCEWCVDFGYWQAMTGRIEPVKIVDVARWRDSTAYSPLERAAIEYAVAMTTTPLTVTDEHVARLCEHLDESQVVELTELDHPCARADVIACNVRWVLLHLIEETARHAGHADLIRETLDGSRGM